MYFVCSKVKKGRKIYYRLAKAYPLFILISECCPFSLIWNMISFILLNRSLSIILENSIHYLVIENIWGIKCFTLLQQPLSENRNGIVKKCNTETDTGTNGIYVKRLSRQIIYGFYVCLFWHFFVCHGYIWCG